MSALVDLSHAIEAGMTTCKGLPGPVICDFLSREASHAHYSPGTEFQIGRIDMVANTGTYLDTPFHRYADGIDLAGQPLDAIADLEAVLVHAPFERSRRIDATAFREFDVVGKAVLVHTGWAQHWGTGQYLEGHPFLTAGAAAYLRGKGVRLVGIDSHNIDDTDDGARPVHTTLLRHDVTIVEHLTNLEALPDHGSRFFAVPPKVREVGTFPVRAFCMV